MLVGGAPLIVFDGVNNTVTIEARATIPTRLMSVVWINEMTVAARTVIQRQVPGMELVLVMDKTGSMRSGGKMKAMKDAAHALMDILYGDREVVDDFWIGLVPYSATVNIGNSRISWMDGFNPNDFNPTSWKGCVEARSYPNDSNDTLPQVKKFQPFLWPATLAQFPNPYHIGGVYDDDQPETWGEYLFGDNNWDPDGPLSDLNEANEDQNNGTGPNLGCGPAIAPLLAAKSSVTAPIDEMQPWHRGGTMANLGLAWGWRVLSPGWRGHWGGATPSHLPQDYATANLVKAIILLTHGVNQWYDWPGATWWQDGEESFSGLPGGNKYPGDDDKEFKGSWPGADCTAFGRLSEGRLGTISGGAATTAINTRMFELCTAVKSQGVIVYTMTFKLSNATAQQLYRDCATDEDHYFNSPSNADLEQTFVQIADDLSSLRITA